VFSTDAFGDIVEGNLGEFAKFLPGVTIDYVSNDARTISLRGVASNYTLLTLDGAQLANANDSGGRQFEFEQVSINNTSRVEIFKSRTPDVAANALGGLVNLVPRSAFERSTATLNYRAFLALNGFERTLRRTRGPGRRTLRKDSSGFDFIYTKARHERLRLHPERSRVERLQSAIFHHDELGAEYRGGSRFDRGQSLRLVLFRADQSQG
jgi:hypothetical protein